MAYTDYEFYTDTYYGKTVSESDFPRLAEKASDFIDAITFGRLVGGLPDNEDFVKKIYKAVCAVAEKMYDLELAEEQARSAAAGGSSATTTDGTSSGVITSKSAGSESISYASPSEMASGASEWSALYSAVGDTEKTNAILYDAAKMYLMGVRTDKRIPVLYAGL